MQHEVTAWDVRFSAKLQFSAACYIASLKFNHKGLKVRLEKQILNTLNIDSILSLFFGVCSTADHAAMSWLACEQATVLALLIQELQRAGQD